MAAMFGIFFSSIHHHRFECTGLCPARDPAEKLPPLIMTEALLAEWRFLRRFWRTRYTSPLRSAIQRSR